MGRRLLRLMPLCLVVASCAHVPQPTPYVQESIRKLRADTAGFYDELMQHVGDERCQYSRNVEFWRSARSRIAILRERAGARPADSVLVGPLDKLASTFERYRAAHEAAETDPAPRPAATQNPRCLPASLAAQNSVVLEDGLDGLLALETLRKESAK